MAQTQIGTVGVTYGSTWVVGSANCNWTDAQHALAGNSPVFFSVVGDAELPYSVTSFTAPTPGPPATTSKLLVGEVDGRLCLVLESSKGGNESRGRAVCRSDGASFLLVD